MAATPNYLSLSQIIILNWDQAQSLVRPLREAVFINEQGIPEDLEWDDIDQNARHIVIMLKNKVIGCARLIVLNQVLYLQRMAITKIFRNLGLGSRLINHSIVIAREKKLVEIKISAQVTAMLFYQKKGFKPLGQIYMEAGIPHQEMSLRVKPNF